MSTKLRNVPNTDEQIRQTRFCGGKDRGACIQVQMLRREELDVTDRFHTYLQLTRNQAKALAIELILFSEGAEVENIYED